MKLFDKSRGIGMNQLGLTVLLASGIAFAGNISANQSALQQKADSIEARQGLEVGGTVRAVFLRSQFSSDQDVDGINIMPDREQDEFAQFDLKLGFRPWASTRVNALLRMGGGMQQYFSAPSKTVAMPWLNIEGQEGKVFYWTAGDFRQQISPLTLYSPDVEMMYEPTVFARNRAMARDQVLLEGNQRNLQGINLQYRDSFEPVGEVRAEGIFSRLRRIEFLDRSGAMGNILPNDSVLGASQVSNTDKYLLSTNVELFPLNKNIMVGATYMMIWDDKKSFTRTLTKVQDSNGSDSLDASGTVVYDYAPINRIDTLLQNTSITSLRVGVDGAGLMANPNLTLDLTAEFAMSTDDLYTFDANNVAQAKANDGKALLAQISAGWKVQDSWMARLDADYISNDSSWFNNVAQSPSFFARRIANNEKDANTAKYGVYSPLYSTFDALYHFNPRFSPAASSLQNDDGGMSNGQTESYNIAPYSKNSWTTTVYTRDELRIVNALSDPNLQMLLPNGLATANRTGLRANLKGGFGKDNLVEGQVIFASLKEVDASIPTIDAAEFSEAGAGAKVDVLGLMGFSLPLEISGSYRSAKRTQGPAELTTTFANASIYGRFHKRLGATVGLQQATMKLNNAQQVLAAFAVPVADGKQMQWMVGVDYTLAKNAWLAINYGQIAVENTYEIGANGVVDATMLPDYILKSAQYSGVTNSSLVHKFTQDLIDVSINVAF